jgi:holin-like protein
MPFARLPALLVQLLFFVAVWCGCDGLIRALHWPVPAGVLGLFLVTALLWVGWLRTRHIEQGARWLLGEMLLFFMPPMMALIQHHELMSGLGLRLVLAVTLGTLIVMGGVGWVVERAIRLEDRWGEAPKRQEQTP